jgi:diguanylate cyclase (GGDEF)-like protein
MRRTLDLFPSLMWGSLGALAGAVLALADGRGWRLVLPMAAGAAAGLGIYGWARGVERRGARDALTGLPTREQGERILRREVARAVRTGLPLTVMFVDLDGFKAINDTRGHLAGDRVLRDVARAMERSVRETDAVIRWGGDEFVVVLPATDVTGAARVAERLGAAAASAGLGASVGVAQWEPGDTVDALVARADRAMYGAKRGGGAPAIQEG